MPTKLSKQRQQVGLSIALSVVSSFAQPVQQREQVIL